MRLLKSGGSTACTTTTKAEPVGPVLQSPPRPPPSKQTILPVGAQCIQVANSTAGSVATQQPLDIETAVLRLLHSSSSTSPTQAPPTPSVQLVSAPLSQQQPTQLQQPQQVILLPAGTSLVSAGGQQLLLLQSTPSTGAQVVEAPPAVQTSALLHQQKPTAYVQPQVQLRPQLCVKTSVASTPAPLSQHPQQTAVTAGAMQRRTVKLYNVGGTLFTGEGEPVSIDNKVLRYLSKDTVEPRLLALAGHLVKEAQRKAPSTADDVGVSSITSSSDIQ